MTKVEHIAEVIKNNGGTATLDTVLQGMLWCVADYKDTKSWKESVRKGLNGCKMFTKTKLGTGVCCYGVADDGNSCIQKPEAAKESGKTTKFVSPAERKVCQELRNDVVVAEWLDGVERPGTFSGLGEMIGGLVDFYVGHSVAERNDVLELVGGVSVFGFSEMLPAGKRKTVSVDAAGTGIASAGVPAVEVENASRRKRTKKESAKAAGKPSGDTGYPVIKKFSSRKEGGRDVWKLAWEDNEIILKNPPRKSITWKYINITQDMHKYKCGKIGDVLYMVYIEGESPYYYMFNNPKDIDRLALKSMYWRMFEYGRYGFGDVRLKKIDEVVYEKTSEIEFK